MVEAIQSNNPYGKIYKTGITGNGRIIYNVIDSSGNDAGKLTLPQKESDTFEKAYQDVIDSAARIQKYTLENSSEADIKNRKILSRVIVSSGGVLGAVAAILLTKNQTSALKGILSMVTGIVTGLSLGFGASLILTSPPESLKFIKASRILSKLDIQHLDNQTK